MKKLIITTIILMLSIILLCNYGLADGKWSVLKPEGTPVTLTKWSQKHQSYLGPDKGSYAQGGAFSSARKGYTAILRENGYVLVDTGKRFVYFPASGVSGAPDHETTLVGYPTVTKTDARPRFGPGENYERLSVRLKSKYAGWSLEDLVEKFAGSYEITEALKDRIVHVNLTSGTSVKVYFEMNGWVFAEFEGELVGLVRAWIPAAQVK